MSLLARTELSGHPELRFSHPHAQPDEEMDHDEDDHRGGQDAKRICGDAAGAGGPVVEEAVGVEALVRVGYEREGEVEGEDEHERD